jgi:hypothetical protein
MSKNRNRFFIDGAWITAIHMVSLPNRYNAGGEGFAPAVMRGSHFSAALASPV